MRLLLLALLTGCPPSHGDCTTDGDCGGDVCTRDGQCTPASEVRSVRLTWTIRGQPASAASCASEPQLYVEVHDLSNGEQIGFEPVPCDQGLFNFDKLPTSYTEAALGLDSNSLHFAPIDTNNTAHFDL